MTVTTDRPAVSVIMPLHEGAKYCVESFQSILAQTVAPDEIIVVDDGSTDGGADLLTATAASAPASIAVRVVRRDNAGQSAARNHGARLATGELLAFIDQDDLWHPRHLEELIAPFAEDDRLGWTYSDFDEIDADGLVVSRGFVGEHVAHGARRSLATLLAADLMVLPSASVIRATAFEEVGGFDPDLQGYEDDDLFIRFFRHDWDAERIPGSLTSYRTHGAGSSANDGFRRSRVRFLDKLGNALPDDPHMNRFLVSDVLAPRLFATTLTEYCIALRMGDDDAARRIAVTATEITERGGAPSWRRRVELWLLRRPATMTRFLRAYEATPRRLRPFIHPALSLRRPGARP